MRYCAACNRPVNEDHHDVRMDPVTHAPAKPGSVLRWVCRMTLVADSPKTGKMVPTHIRERVSEINNRFVHTDRLEQQA